MIGSPDAVFVGVATWDTVAQLPRLPAPDGRVVAEEIVGAGGGPAATAAVAFARLGLRPALVAAVGDDREGALIRDGLAAEGVDISDVHTVPGRPSGSCVVLVDRPRGSRAICVRPGPGLEIAPDSAAGQAVLSARLLHVDHLGWPAVEPLLAALPATAPRPLVCYDAGNLEPRRCPDGVDVYVPTLAALREVYGVRDPRSGSGPEPRSEDLVAPLRAAHAGGAARVVATDGAAGAVAADGAGFHRVPGLTGIDVRSTLGAGDVFHGALVAAFARDLPLPAALAYANAAAALSCRGLDGRSAIPGHEETAATAARHPATTLDHPPAVPSSR
ncbi:carbohydrate kinase family protein [Streptosporangium sp. NBC_01756]|uniref:carbohydrate kinase family protein n=1 Tax=Streptosporangium sp. NBC_01756 TaxID=2975950 RepID=UPI002DDC623F|nr:PfkB family carbohydrate kinase [Streptosporangium sp. NBC_01756]WSC86877.1 PfkB family carbohydrate kinase [Streptosporangium sp. NBC_01756]